MCKRRSMDERGGGGAGGTWGLVMTSRSLLPFNSLWWLAYRSPL